MSKNIYDLFNERKNGVDCLVEGYDFNIDHSLEFEDLDAAMEALEDITLESTNEMIEFRAASFLEDLVLENMMYEDFDEERLLYVMEAAKEEKKGGLVQKIKDLWEKIKQWFAAAYRSIANHFASGEQLVRKYKKEIPAAIAQAKGKVKMRSMNEFKNASAQVAKQVEKIQTKGKSKQDILDLVHVRDVKEIPNMVENFYYSNKEAVEREIKSLPAHVLIEWAGNKNVYIDALKKTQKDTDRKFKDILEEIKQEGQGKEGDAAAKVAEDAANFQFGITVMNKILSAEINCVKNISKACTAIIKKALGGKYDASKDPYKAGATDEDRRRQAEYEKNIKAGFSRKDSAAMARGKLYEEEGEDGKGKHSGKSDGERAYDANRPYATDDQANSYGPNQQSKYDADAHKGRKNKKDEKKAKPTPESFEFIDDEYDNNDIEW